MYSGFFTCIATKPELAEALHEVPTTSTSNSPVGVIVRYTRLLCNTPVWWLGLLGLLVSVFSTKVHPLIAALVSVKFSQFITPVLPLWLSSFQTPRFICA